MPINIIFDNIARRHFFGGVMRLGQVASMTMGPGGRSVMLERQAGLAPALCTESHLLAESMELGNPFEEMGLRAARSAARDVVETAGDGACSTLVLASQVLREGFLALEAGANPVQLREGMFAATGAVVESMAERVEPCDTPEAWEATACSAARGDTEIAGLIAKAFGSVGHERAVLIEQSSTGEDRVTVSDGHQIDAGFAAAWTPPGGQSSFEMINPLVFLSSGVLATVEHVLGPMELAISAGRPLLVIADSIQADALAVLTANTLRGTISAIGVSPRAFDGGRGEPIEDIAVLTGGYVFSQEFLGGRVRLNDFGRADRICVSAEHTTFFGPGGDAESIRARREGLQWLRQQPLDTKSPTGEVAMRSGYTSRIETLAPSVAKIEVGGAIDTIVQERMRLCETAHQATRSAMLEGIVVGGGLAWVSAGKQWGAHVFGEGSRAHGAQCVLSALTMPAQCIIRNAGEPQALAARVIHDCAEGQGYDVALRRHGSMRAMGIVDAFKVARLALMAAVGLSGVATSTSAMITRKASHAVPPSAPELGRTREEFWSSGSRSEVGHRAP